MNDLHRAVALAESKEVALRAANARARHRLTAEGRRHAFGVRLRWLAVSALAAGLVHGFLAEVDRQEEKVRVETALHRERMYSQRYRRESCEHDHQDLVSETFSCERERGARGE